MEADDDAVKTSERETLAQCLKRKKRDYILNGTLNSAERRAKKSIVDSLTKNTQDAEELKIFYGGSLSSRLLHWLDQENLCYAERGYGFDIWVDENNQEDYGIKRNNVTSCKRRRKTEETGSPEEPQQCIVCQDSEADTTVVPCCHTVACKACSDKLKTTTNAKTCILCRQAITHVLEPQSVRKVVP